MMLIATPQYNANLNIPTTKFHSQQTGGDNKMTNRNVIFTALYFLLNNFSA